MVSALLMFHRLARTLRYAVREEDFLRVLSAAALLVAIGTVTCSARDGTSWTPSTSRSRR